MINQLILPQRVRARSLPQKDDATGLPAVLFCCLSHVDAGGNRILVASCSTDQWGTFLKRALHAWRAGRFQAGPHQQAFRPWQRRLQEIWAYLGQSEGWLAWDRD